MKKMVGTCICFLFISTSLPVQSKEVLTGDQVKEALSGNTLEYLHRTKKVLVLVKPGGELSARMQERKQKGKWYVNGEGHWCRKWKKWLKGKEGCFQVVHKTGDSYEFRWKSGQGGSNIDVKVHQGNPKDL